MRLSEVSTNVFYIYNFFLLLGLFWLISIHRRDRLSLFLILLFFPGVFVDLGGNIGLSIYRILILLWSIYLLISYKYSLNIRHYSITSLIFFLFILTFIFNTSIQSDDTLIIFSQLTKYIVPFLVFFIMYNHFKNANNMLYINKLFGQILILQIFFTIIKLFLIGINNFVEGWVGSLTGFSGGGVGTTLPLLGLLWVALNRRNKMISTINSILFLVGLLLMGFASYKRAVVVLFPVFYVISYLVLNFKLKFQQIPVIIFLGFVYFYLGLRLIPSLNPDNKIWGSFDPVYSYEYGLKYSTGSDEFGSEHLVAGVGRVGTVLWFWESLTKFDDLSVFTGSGLEYFYRANSDNYTSSIYYQGIITRGSITGIVSMYMTVGIICVLLYITYIISLLFDIKNKRFSLIILVIILFDFIFYNATIINLPSLFILLIFLSFYSRVNYDIKSHNIEISK